MIKKIGDTTEVQRKQVSGYSKLWNASLSLLLLVTIFMASCRKESSQPAQATPTITSSTTTPLATVTDEDAPPLYLGTAIDFTILSQTGISTTGVTSITGNIGASPIAGTGLTGFGLIMDASNKFSRSSLVVGKVFASNYAPPSPARMTTAINDLKTAYTKANNRTFPAPIIARFAGDLSGRNLPPGLYKWSTGVLITNVGVTLTGMADDVWVLTIAKDLTVNNGATITLRGGALAKNVFWVVAGKATLGTTVNFSGNILSQTLISVNAGTQVHGRLLAQSAVTLIADDVKPL